MALESIPAPNFIPWYLQQLDRPFRWRDAPELNAIVVQLRQNFDSPDQKIISFLRSAEAERRRLGRQNVVLDLRANGGGNLLLTRDFMIGWPSALDPNGRFYVLTSAQTFSAAIANVAYLKQAGGDRVIIVGEPIGDRLMFFSEGLAVPLPYAGISVQPATARHDWLSGCRQFTDCASFSAQPEALTATPPDTAAALDEEYGRRPISIRSAEPDVRVNASIADFIRGEDAAMIALSAHR